MIACIILHTKDNRKAYIICSFSYKVCIKPLGVCTLEWNDEPHVQLIKTNNFFFLRFLCVCWCVQVHSVTLLATLSFDVMCMWVWMCMCHHHHRWNKFIFAVNLNSQSKQFVWVIFPFFFSSLRAVCECVYVVHCDVWRIRLHSFALYQINERYCSVILHWGDSLLPVSSQYPNIGRRKNRSRIQKHPIHIHIRAKPSA